MEPLQNKVGRATKRAAQELTGDDGNFVVTTDLGNEFAQLDRELPAEAVHRTKRPEDRNAIAVVDRGIQTLKKDEGGAQGSGMARRTWRSSRHGVQDNADKFQHNKDLTDRRVKAVEDAGAFRAPTNAARSFNPSTATCSGWGPWTPYRPLHGGPRDPAEAALPAP